MKKFYNFTINLLLICVLTTGTIHAQLVVDPDSWSFQPQQIGTQSEEAVFIIENQGASTVSLSPEQISIVSQNEQSISLSVLTYNIWFDNQNWPARFAHMLGEIRDLDPDIIGLQEVIQRANLDNQAQMMADSLGYYYYFSSVDAETSSQRFGNAILSRYPIEESNWKALLPLNDYRTVAHIRINVEGNVIDVYNTHLHNVAVNTHIREEQILDMLNFIDQTTSNEYIFVTGDYNANPDWEEMELMYEDFYDVYPVFHENHLDPEHSTLNYNLGHQQRRIDYIFFNKASASTLIPGSAEVVIDEPDENGIYGSDHFGVFATFDFLSDADAFLLNNLDEAVELAPGESTQIGLIFAPFLTGEHLAFLSVADQQIPVNGEGFDATIYEFPWEEDFTNLDNSDIPMGWERNAENWGAFSSNYAGGETPEMVFWWQPVQEGEFFVQTPLINTAGLDSMNLSFRNVVDNFGDPGIYNLKVVTITGDQEHIIQQWTNPASIPAEEITVQINSSDHGIGEGIIRIAWIFEGSTDNLTRWAIDDVVLSAEPALEVNPGSFVFDPQEINSASEIKIFTLSNIGGGVLAISPDDISIEGDDQEEFQLFNLTEEVELGNMESIEIGISFFPQSEGLKSAYLTVLEHNITIEGIAYDPTIYELPWIEDFGSLTGGGIPLGWTRSTINWGAFNSDNAGGDAPEMVFWWQPESSGQFYLTSPQIITTGLDSLVLAFKYRVNNFGPPGNYTLKVIAIANETEYLINQWVNPDDIPANEFIAIIDSQNHGLGNDNFHLAWVFDGITDNITQWDIDDIMLMEIGDSPVPEVTPASYDFGQQSIDSASEPVEFTIRNIGGGTLSISADDITITGTDADAFILGNLDTPVDLGPFESTTIMVTFAPVTTGEKSAVLGVLNIDVPLSGIGTEPTDYFIYSDFSIPGFTNVEGFREIPGWAQGITATDITGEGEFGNVVLKLDYNLGIVDDQTAYWMWAFPSADISGYSQIVLFVKADEPVSDVKVQIFDTDGIQGNDGASYTYIDIENEWHSIIIPVSDFITMDWADNPPDMSKIQRIDLLFEEGVTQPQQTTVYVDLVGFSQDDVFVPEVNSPVTLNIYPNPASNFVNIQAETGAEITIMDISGRIILKTTAGSEIHLLDVSDFNKGIYLIQVQNQYGRMIKKLLIN
jgi:endonuclease/exonuclease/phosphatase family metal-dependent hydrolase